MEAGASSPAYESPPAPAGRPLRITDLPREVQVEIMKHCSNRDLVCVALVSRHFRALAAEQLYRVFRIVFPDEDNLQFDTPSDSLASRFDTFVTSDFDYAQYLRILHFDTLHMGDKAAMAYRPYLANLSCGKFMNTLLLLTLRRARALETFRWNIRVELSRAVYRELHSIRSLTHLHLRLHAGPSQYETPPPLPYTPTTSTPSPAPAHAAPIASLPPPPPPQPMFGLMPPPPPPPGGFYVPASAVAPPPPPPPSKLPRPRSPKKSPPENEPPTLSGFTKLKTLAVLDIDTLDLVDEIAGCVRNSASTLSKLKLSFSGKLASSARRPQMEPEPEDSDQDEDMMTMPQSTHVQNDEMSGPARAFRAQEERKTQESVLARILGVESAPPEKVQPATVPDKKKSKVKSEQELIDFMKTIAPKFMAELNGTTDFAPSQDVLDMIGVAAKKYLEEAKAQKDASQNGSSSGSNGSNTPTPQVAPSLSDASASLFNNNNNNNNSSSSTGASTGKKKATYGTGNPDDFDIEEPEEQLSIEPGDPVLSESEAQAEEAPVSTEPDSSRASCGSAALTGSQKVSYYNSLIAELKALKDNNLQELEQLESQLKTLAKEVEQARNSKDFEKLSDTSVQLMKVTRRIQEMNREQKARQAKLEQVKTPSEEAVHVDHMRDYVRETRGIPLRSLAIYLIPAKASVLSRAIDLRMLRRLTLLNVGIQAPIWALLHKENSEAPLPLRKISTDNVSLVFLKFVAALREVEELFLLERENKSKPESFAPRTRTTIDQIRRLALKKHMPSLRRLIVKNLADTTWDMNEKAVLLLSRQGRRLEELACNMSIRAMHCLMQHIAGLSQLRALHVVHLRSDDTCVWVMRETKQFLIDNVSHYPHLKLEWIAINEDDRADRLIRTSSWRDGNGSNSGKGKEKDAGSTSAGSGTSAASGDQKGKGKSLLPDPGVSAEEVDVSVMIATELGSSGSGGSWTGGGGGGSGSSGSSAGLGLGIGGSNSAAAALDESDSEDETGEDGGFLGQKIETVEGISFCDIEGVRIFKKEVVAGRL